MNKTIKIDVRSTRYQDYDDVFAAVVGELQDDRELVGYSLDPRWGDDDRESVLVDLPEWAVRDEDEIVS